MATKKFHTSCPTDDCRPKNTVKLPSLVASSFSPRVSFPISIDSVLASWGYDTRSLSARFNVIRWAVPDACVHHVEYWFLAAQFHLPYLPPEPTREADAEDDAQSAESDRDSNLPSLPIVFHWILSVSSFLFEEYWYCLIAYFTDCSWRRIYTMAAIAHVPLMRRRRSKRTVLDIHRSLSLFLAQQCIQQTSAHAPAKFPQQIRAHPVPNRPLQRQREPSPPLISSPYQISLPTVSKTIPTNLGLVDSRDRSPSLLAVFLLTLTTRSNDSLRLRPSAEFNVIECVLTNRM